MTQARQPPYLHSMPFVEIHPLRDFASSINRPPEIKRTCTILERMKNTKKMHENGQPDSGRILQFASNEAEAAA